MNNADLMEILGIADLIEAGYPGWHIAAVKLRAFVGAYKLDVEDVAKINVGLVKDKRALEKTCATLWDVLACNDKLWDEANRKVTAEQRFSEVSK